MQTGIANKKIRNALWLHCRYERIKTYQYDTCIVRNKQNFVICKSNAVEVISNM